MSRKANSRAKTSVFYAIVSNTIVLALIGLFLLLYFHTNSITALLKERINIIVELSDGRSTEDTRNLARKIQEYPEVKPGSVAFIPASRAMEVLGQDFEEDWMPAESPFKDVIVFNVLAEHYYGDKLLELKTNIKKSALVSDVIYENLVIDNFKSNLNKMSFGIFILNIIFLILVVVIMYNTINLSLYADRWEIKTMEIIGARDRFIRQPYLKIAGRIALTSFALSTVLILLTVGLAYFNIDLVQGVLHFGYLITSLLVIFFLALFINIVSTIRIVNNYLFKEEEALYE